ncbi:hypothetical protein [Sutcliffiella cohnii]|uniref:hypothetical protein n=1 Tax=Sutcliffiella cohnii TaxID=33932 RepID=UPI000B318123|nr:hypothetical protein [Sutcliffiella cohnii]
MENKEEQVKKPLAKCLDVRKIAEKYSKKGFKVEVCKPRISLIKELDLQISL